MARTYLTY